MAMNGLRAMMTNAYGYALRINELAHIMWVNSRDIECHRSDSVIAIGRAKNPHALYIANFQQFLSD